MRKNPERVAWIVLTAAFATFCILAVGIPLGIRSYLLNSMVVQDSKLQVIEGIVLVQEVRRQDLTAVIEEADLSPGDEVLTDSTSMASLDLFERSHLTLYSNTKLKLEQVRTPRFTLSPHPNQIVLHMTGGLLRVGVAMPGERPTRFEVITPHTSLLLDEGSYRIEVTNQGTQITVVRGQARVQGNGVRMTVPQGTRTLVDLNGEPAAPLPAARNLIVNGNFQQPLETTWITNTLILDSSASPPGIEVVEDGGRRSVHLVRRGPEEGLHSEVSIQQKLDQDVRDFVRLEVLLDVKLNFQSLSGGGMSSSEFPVIVRLDYKDRWGNNQFWTHGFYYQNQAGYPIAMDPWGRPAGERIPRDVWYPYESGNLLELLGESGPVHVTGLTVYASGWNYDSLVTEIQLVAE
ncbi:MAG: FecR domain-containing protein [Anaerolineae bacterium]